MIEREHAKKYDTETVASCEYMQSMAKVYAKPPNLIGNACAGYRNPYMGGLSTVCQKCKNLYQGEYDER